MDHALMLNSSEGPCKDGEIEGAVLEGQVPRIGAHEADPPSEVGRTLYQGDPQVIGKDVHARDVACRPGILPGEPSIAAADLQHAHVTGIEFRISVKIPALDPLWINLNGHGSLTWEAASARRSRLS